MNESLLVKYKSLDDNFDLALLGESLSGLSAVFKDLCDLTKINGEVEVRLSRVEHGSIELFNHIHIQLSTTLPFSNPLHLYHFLQVVSPEMCREAKEFFSTVGNTKDAMNQYFTRNPFDQSLVTGFILLAVQWAAFQKKNPVTRVDGLGEITPAQARKLHSMVRTGRFKRVLKPITEGNTSTIILKNLAANATVEPVAITETNLEKYLPEEAQILPEFANGETVTLTGKILSLQSTHGESLKIKVDGLSKSTSLLNAYPADGLNTENFAPFYKREVLIAAQVVRRSMYKRPELVISDVQLLQSELNVNTTENEQVAGTR